MKVANKLRWVVGEIDPTGFGLYPTSVPPGVIVQKFQTQSLSGISEEFLQEVTALHSKYTFTFCVAYCEVRGPSSGIIHFSQV